jgi:hypothetical protein
VGEMTVRKFPTLKIEPKGIKEIPNQSITNSTKELIEKGLENALLKIVAKNKLTIRPKLDYCLIVGYLSNLLFEDMMTHNSSEVRNYIATEIVPKLMNKFNLKDDEMKEFAQKFRDATNH